MEIWPIDFDKTLQEISEWIDSWKVERYGADSLNPERYYKLTPDGRYIYGKGGEGVAEGESLNKEKADSEKLLDILCRLRLINQKLKGKGLSQHLQWQKREELEKERETLYKDFLDIVKATQEPQRVELDVFETDEAKKLFERAIAKGLISADGNKYKWNDTASLYGYFVDKTSDFLNIRPSNNRIPWKKYERIIINHSILIATAKQAINDYKNKELSPPEGDDKVNDICK